MTQMGPVLLALSLPQTVVSSSTEEHIVQHGERLAKQRLMNSANAKQNDDAEDASRQGKLPKQQERIVHLPAQSHVRNVNA